MAIEVNPGMLAVLTKQATGELAKDNGHGERVLALVEAYRVLRDEIDRTRLAIEEAGCRAHDAQITVVVSPSISAMAECGDEEAQPKLIVLPPDAVRGVMQYVRQCVRELGDWTAYDAWEREPDLKLRVERADLLVEACGHMLSIAYVGKGKIVCPDAFIQPIRKMAQVLNWKYA